MAHFDSEVSSELVLVPVPIVQILVFNFMLATDNVDESKMVSWIDWDVFLVIV